mgnify:CR=1
MIKPLKFWCAMQILLISRRTVLAKVHQFLFVGMMNYTITSLQVIITHLAIHLYSLYNRQTAKGKVAILIEHPFSKKELIGHQERAPVYERPCKQKIT